MKIAPQDITPSRMCALLSEMKRSQDMDTEFFAHLTESLTVDQNLELFGEIGDRIHKVQPPCFPPMFCACNAMTFLTLGVKLGLMLQESIEGQRELERMHR